MKDDNEQFLNVGKFTSLSWVPGDLEGNNLVRKLHKHYKVLGPDKPEDIGIRIIEIPPFGKIPVHDHDIDEFSSWVICISGYGEHIVEINKKIYTHAMKNGEASVSTQKMSELLAGKDVLLYRHGFNAGKYGMTLMNIFRPSEITDERLSEIQAGK